MGQNDWHEEMGKDGHNLWPRVQLKALPIRI